MARSAFATWLTEAPERPFPAGNVVWTTAVGALLLKVGNARYRIAESSRRQIVLLI